MAGSRYSLIPKASWQYLGPAYRGLDADLHAVEANVSAGGGGAPPTYSYTTTVAAHGGVGDGSTDDRAALVAALADVTSHGGGTVILPDSTTKIVAGPSANYIVIPANVTIVGAGSASAIAYHTTEPTVWHPLFRVENDNVAIRNVRITRSAALYGCVVDLRACTGFTMSDVAIDGARGTYSQELHGVYLYGSTGSIRNVTLRRVNMRSLDYGLLKPSSQLVALDGFTADSCNFTGQYATDLELNAPAALMRNITITASSFSASKANTSGAGFAVGLAHVTSAAIIGCTFSDYASEPVHVEDVSQNVLISGCRFTRCGTRASPYASHVFVISGSKNITVTGCTFDVTQQSNAVTAVYVGPGGAYSDPSNVTVAGNSYFARPGATFTADYTASATAISSIGNQTAPPTPTAVHSTALRGGRKWAFCGDSITAGSGSTNSTVYGYQNIAWKIAGGRYIDTNRIDGGVPGDASANLLSRMPGILSQRPDGCFVMIGTNDTDLPTWAANVRSIKSLIDNAGIPSVWGTVPPRGAPTAAQSALVAAQNVWLKRWAPSAGVVLADSHAALTDPATGVLNGAFDSGDGVHPSNAGHAIIGDVVAKAIQQTLRPAPWPVTSAGLGRLTDPTFTAGKSGWDIIAGPSFPADTFRVPVTGELPAGRWLRWTLDNSGGGTATSSAVGVVVPGTWSAGDVALVCLYVRASDASVIIKVQLLREDTYAPFSVFLDDLPTATPGPIMAEITIPSGISQQIVLSIPMSARVGQADWLEIGACDVFNLTRMGL